MKLRVFAAVRELSVSVIVGASAGERQFIGFRQVAAVVKSVCEEHNFPVFLNADRTHSLHSPLKAATAGFDWIMFDVSTQPFEQNVRQSKEAVETLRVVRPEILLGDEIGDIRGSSEIHYASPRLRKELTTPAEVKQFIEETKIDTLAPIVGNMHGML